MTGWWWIAIGISVVIASGAGVAVWLWSRSRGHDIFERARKKFLLRREWLEAEFLTRAAASGKPRGLKWTDCDFEDPVAFAADRRTGRYRALVGVTIRFEAIEGGGMEDVEAVGNLKAATVVFRLDGPEWEADGRAFFNLTPKQTIEHYQHELDTVDQILANLDGSAFGNEVRFDSQGIRVVWRQTAIKHPTASNARVEPSQP